MSSPWHRCGAIAGEDGSDWGQSLDVLGVTVTGNRIRKYTAGLAATLMLTVSASALHAETSNNELAKEIAELKAQIRAMKGAITQNRAETRKAVRVARTPAAPYQLPPPNAPVFAGGVIPPGATPVFVTADKKMQFGALTITPGGFFAMESANRTRGEAAGLSSAFGSIPTNNSPLAHVGESRFEARQSRPALLIEAPITPNYLVSGYAELDFLGAGLTSNFNQTDSYVPRIRHLYSTLDNSEYGMHVLAGQEWSLITLNSKGITPRNEVTPPQIDPSYIPGFEYARLPQIRLTKDFNKKLWLAVDLEAAQTANINGVGNCQNVINNTGANLGTVPATGTNATGSNTNNITANTFTGVTGGTCLSATGAPNLGQTGLNESLSLNKIPDVLVKAAYEARLGERDIHLEVTGIYRDLYNNTNYGAVVTSTNTTAGGYPFSTNHDTTGYGVGAGLIAPILPRRLDFQIQGLVGRGLGRYASTNALPDAAVEADGRLHAVGAASALTGVIAHITPSFDLYGFAGFEQVNRTFSTIGGVPVGYGTTVANNYGCNLEGGNCTGQTHRVIQFTGGMWDKLYKGSFGEVRVGAQYSYTERFLFGGTTNVNGIGTAAAPIRAARANDNTILTSFRYYPFQ